MFHNDCKALPGKVGPFLSLRSAVSTVKSKTNRFKLYLHIQIYTDNANLQAFEYQLPKSCSFEGPFRFLFPDSSSPAGTLQHFPRNQSLDQFFFFLMEHYLKES